MKALQLLLVCTAAVVAKDSISYVDHGLCSWQSSTGLMPENGLCFRGSPTIKEAVNEEQKLAESLWPIATSCATGSNGTDVYCVYSNPSFAGGRGITILTSPSEAIKLAKSTAFTNPTLYQTVKDFNAPASPRWRVEEVPGKGMGLIANQNLQTGDHIMSVSASIMVDYRVYDDVSEPHYFQMQANGIDLLPHRAIFLNLSTHDEAEDYVSQVHKIILTNAFDISDAEVIRRPENEKEERFYTVFPEISRMNHDCRPTSHYYFDPYTFTQNVFAVRPIAAGEEITISYVDPFLPREERLWRLDHSWHFPCSCSLCTQHERLSLESDARIAQILELQREMLKWDSPKSKGTPEMAELLLSLYEQERLDSRIYEPYMYAAIEYSAAGQVWPAIKYARLALQHGFIASGYDGEDSYDMGILAENPREHWSWMMREKKE
ncbi:hypothetical protein BJ170DRAFT_683268 [Xylariales sp. AK1849]|nr:hypothetical protein BJ170DRAFT_683268 [Xylariales sp. AK1849]